MGMYDELICRYPLPGTIPGFINKDHRFQTKDLNCWLEEYVIEEDGSFYNTAARALEGPRQVKDFTGTIEFYTSNWCGSHGEYEFTSDGSDLERIRFEAKIVNGKLTSIVQTSYSSKKALSASEMSRMEVPTKEQIKKFREKTAQPMKGRSMFVQYGGDIPGYSVKVLEETENELCMLTQSGKLEVMSRQSYGTTLFDSEEESKAYTQHRNEQWENEQQRYKQLLAAKS